MLRRLKVHHAVAIVAGLAAVTVPSLAQAQAPTATVLVSSGSPSVHGDPVTITATVTPLTPGPAPQGTARFLDGAVVLGTVPLDASGQASLVVTTLLRGSHSLSAAFDGSIDHAPSASGSVLQQVLGRATATTLVTSGSPSFPGQVVTLTARVVSPAGPVSGAVEFFDGSTLLGSATLDLSGQASLAAALGQGTHLVSARYAGGAVLGASRSAPVAQQVGRVGNCIVSFAPLAPLPVGDAPESVGSADFDGDGNADLAVASLLSDEVAILLGDGAGGFVPAAGSPFPVAGPFRLVVGDLDDDGDADVAATQLFDDGVTVLLGDASGGFTVGAPVDLGATPAGITAWEDGGAEGPDLAVAIPLEDRVAFLSGDGGGSFTPEPGTGAGTFPTALAQGDLDGDGLPDLVIANEDDNSLTLFLSQSPAATVPVGASPVAVAVADLNTDGLNDIVVVNQGDDEVQVLLGGSGGGRFAVGAQPAALAVADFDLDGSLDIAVANAGDDTTSVLLGDGLGGFVEAPGSPLSAGFAPGSVSAADLNGDGKPDLSVGNAAGSDLSLFLNTCAAPTETAVSSSLATVEAGQPLTLTATVGPQAPGAGTPSGTVVFRDGASVLGSASLAGPGQAALTTALSGAGAHSITADYAGDADFMPSSSPATGVTVVAGAPVALTLDAPPAVTVGVGFDVTVTARNAFGAATPAYGETVSFSTTAASSTLPPSHSFVPGDGGVRTFPVVLGTVGPQTLTVSDGTLGAEASIAVGVPGGPVAVGQAGGAGATLFLPYFEVDLDDPSGATTLLSINNASARAVLTRVTFWTDQGVRTLGFNVYLTGYDIQTINLRDVLIEGRAPETAPLGQDPDDTRSPAGDLSEDRAVGSCAGFLPPPPLSPALLAHVQAAHTGQPSSVFSGQCAGRNLGDRRARGYVTIDTVRSCGVEDPGDPGYFLPGGAGIATNENVLWGDYIMIENPAENMALGDQLVSLQASSGDARTSAPGAYTFYGHLVGGSAADNRSSLATTFAVRYLTDGTFDAGTRLLVWRDPGQATNQGTFACAAGRPALGQNGLLIFDETENPTEGVSLAPFPAASNQAVVGGPALPVPSPYGWMFLNLRDDSNAGPPFGPVRQGWVGAVMTAEGRYMVGYRAVSLDGAATPAN